MAKPIGTLGTIDTLTVGGRVFTDLTNLIILGMANGGGFNSTFRKQYPTNVTGAGYQVTGGKSLTLWAAQILALGADNIQILYSDNDVGLSSGTAFTNPVYPHGNTGYYIWSSTGGVNIATSFKAWHDINMHFVIPAAKYVSCIIGTNTTAANVYGYEA